MHFLKLASHSPMYVFELFGDVIMAWYIILESRHLPFSGQLGFLMQLHVFMVLLVVARELVVW